MFNFVIDADVDVRLVKPWLVEGETYSEGILELYFKGVRLTVCGDYDINTNYAHVVCRQLGYPEGNHQVIYQFGENYGEERSVQFWFSELDCIGTESSIGDCSNDDLGITRWCSQSDDVGVRCQGNVFSFVF